MCISFRNDYQQAHRFLHVLMSTNLAPPRLSAGLIVTLL